MLFCLITAGQSGCRTPGVLGSRGDSLSGRLNSPLNGDLHFAGADNGMNAPEPADFQEATGEKSDSSWSGLWARLKPSRTLTLPRTDFRSGQESISEAQASTALE
ncbi:MAG: hypothetical protein VB858_18405, partial [Planctomycetaceae bacterium]